MRLKLAMVTLYPERDGMITGGVEGAAQCLVTGLRQIADMDIHIIAPSFHNKSRLERRDGIVIHWLEMPPVPCVLANFSLFRLSIHSRLAAIKPDITHFQGCASWVIGYKRPSVFTLHGIYEKDMHYKDGPFLALRRFLIAVTEQFGRQQCRNVILISPYVLSEIGRQLRGRYWNIENPVVEEFFKTERASQSSRILFAGRVSKRKNIDGLLKAFDIVREHIPNATMHIAGTIESLQYYNSCQEFVVEHQLSKAVHFLGNVNRTELLKQLREASCLALVSHQETAPMIVEEAMAAGVPVVASRIGGLPYMVQEGQTGYLIEPNSINEIAASLIKLLESKEVNNAMGERSRQVAYERFHARKVAERTLTAYYQILANMENHV